MGQEKTAGADNPHGLVVVKRIAPATYQASTETATDIAPWEPIGTSVARVIAKIARSYQLSPAVARVVVEQSGLGRRAA